MNQPVPNSNAEQLVTTYCATWNEPRAERREEILKSVWADGATYTDPTVHAVGIKELVDHIGRVLQSYPGAKVVRTSAVEAHHGWARFAWKMVLADGKSLPEGIDFVEISPQNKINRIVGFFGPLARV